MRRCERCGTRAPGGVCVERGCGGTVLAWCDGCGARARLCAATGATELAALDLSALADVVASRNAAEARLTAALCIDRIQRVEDLSRGTDFSASSHPAEPTLNAGALRAAFERLLDLGVDDAALEWAVAACAHDGRWSAAARLAVELWQIHFGETASAGAESNATIDITLDALRRSSRLRPHARGRLGIWERTLLRSALP